MVSSRLSAEGTYVDIIEIDGGRSDWTGDVASLQQ